MVTCARWKAIRGKLRYKIGALNLSVFGGLVQISVKGCAETVNVLESDSGLGAVSTELRKLNMDMAIYRWLFD